MKPQTTVFGQILNLIPRDRFQRIVDRYRGDYKTHKMNCWTQFVTLLYGQLRNKSSLRDIETGLETQSKKLYHLGIIKNARRSTLADANRTRNPEIYESAFKMLLSIYPWAKWSRVKGAVRLHVGLESNSGLPEFAVITEGKVGEHEIARSFPVRSDSIIVVDRGYIDYAWFQHLNDSGAIFVTRAKVGTSYTKIGQHPVEDKSIRSDIQIRIPKIGTHRKCLKAPLRMITYVDPDTGKAFDFLTNSTEHTASQIADIYRKRWEIETFFRWIKQNLTIKTFMGTSKNAVLTQIWIALPLYLLLWFIHYQARWSKQQFLKLLRVLADSALDYRSILELLRGPVGFPQPPPQLLLFNF